MSHTPDFDSSTPVVHGFMARKGLSIFTFSASELQQNIARSSEFRRSTKSINAAIQTGFYNLVNQFISLLYNFITRML